MPPAARRHLGEPTGNASGVEENRRDQYQGRAIIHGAAESGRQRLERSLGNTDDGEAFLLEAVELPADAVEFAVGGDQPGAGPQRQGGQQTDHQLVGVRPQRDPASGVSQQPGESLADPLGLSERVLPLVVHVSRRVQPGSHLAVEATVGPGLVGVPGEQQALRYSESGVVGREGVGGGVEGRGVHGLDRYPSSGFHHGGTEDTEAARIWSGGGVVGLIEHPADPISEKVVGVAIEVRRPQNSRSESPRGPGTAADSGWRASIPPPRFRRCRVGSRSSAAPSSRADSATPCIPSSRSTSRSHSSARAGWLAVYRDQYLPQRRGGLHPPRDVPLEVGPGHRDAAGRQVVAGSSPTASAASGGAPAAGAPRSRPGSAPAPSGPSSPGRTRAPGTGATGTRCRTPAGRGTRGTRAGSSSPGCRAGRPSP